MKLFMSLALAAVMSVFMAGCACGKSECKKAPAVQPKTECKKAPACCCKGKTCCPCKKAAVKKNAAKKAPAKKAVKKAPAKKAAAKKAPAQKPAEQNAPAAK